MDTPCADTDSLPDIVIRVHTSTTTTGVESPLTTPHSGGPTSHSPAPRFGLPVPQNRGKWTVPERVGEGSDLR